MRQSKHIDVLRVLDGTYAIVIVDKTHTEAHSNQLAKYLTDIRGWGYQPENILAMYFKTGDSASTYRLQTCKGDVVVKHDHSEPVRLMD